MSPVVPKTQDGEMIVLETHAIKITKSEAVVLDGAELAIRQGNFTALVGPSGSGKTSLLRVLAFLDRPSAGVIRLWGNEFDVGAGMRPQVCDVYPMLTYVPQTIALWPHLTLRENLTFALSANQASEAIDEMSDLLEISAILDRKPAFVSHGQRQRAALARALVLRPRILLLDEITAALDDRLASKVWLLLREKTREGVSILASTHDVNLSAACDQTYRIHDNTATFG